MPIFVFADHLGPHNVWLVVTNVPEVAHPHNMFELVTSNLVSFSSPMYSKSWRPQNMNLCQAKRLYTAKLSTCEMLTGQTCFVTYKLTTYLSIYRYRFSYYQADSSTPEFGSEGLRTSTAHCPGHGKKNCTQFLVRQISWLTETGSLISFLISGRTKTSEDS